MSKIVISKSEAESVIVPSGPLDTPKVPPPIPLWARLVMLPLVLVLPVLALVALVMRLALRAGAPRTQQAWHSYMSALLIAASFLFTLSAVLLYTFVPTPPQFISVGLTDFDERSSFPSLPSASPMTGVDVSHQLKQLVMVASPAARPWFGRGDAPSDHIGAAVLLQANAQGYLFATARHVAQVAGSSLTDSRHVLLSTGHTGWSGADVIAWHRTADVALLWVSRHSGAGEFVQPLATADQMQEGVNVFVIGHPQGLNFTISNGMISRLEGDTIQISAPISPGNSGGPVYDSLGNLLGVVTSKLDRNVAPNAENLNFAASAELLRAIDGWEFTSEGQKYLSAYINQLQSSTEHKKASE